MMEFLNSFVYSATRYAVVPKTIIFESSPTSALIRDSKAPKVFLTLGMMREYCGTLASVGGSAASTVEMEV